MRSTRLASLLAAMLVVTGCASNQETATRPPDRPRAHPHPRAGCQPADGALFVASHGGLFRLISSSVAGRSWRSVVLEGGADLHVIRLGREVFYAQNAHDDQLFEGAFGGSGLSQRTSQPGTTIDLAVDPRTDCRLFAATDRGVFVSDDRARHWKRLDRRRTGLLVFAGRTLVMIDGGGGVSASSGLGRPWKSVGALPGRPAAVCSEQQGLLAATQDGRVYQSSDAGRRWSLRAGNPNR